MEKIFIATLDKIMAELKPVIEQQVKDAIIKRINSQKDRLNKLTPAEMNARIEALFASNLGEDIEHVVKEISLGVLRHCNNWKIQLATLATETLISGSEIATYTDNICDKFLAELTALSNSSIDYIHNYDDIIQRISQPTANLLYSKIVSITGKVVITLPKALYRGYKKHQEHKADKEAIKMMKEKIEGIKAADKTAACVHEAVSETLEIDSEHLSHSSGLATSKTGASIEDTKNLYKDNGITAAQYKVEDAIARLKSVNSDRAVACFTDSKGGGHASTC